MHVWNNFIIYVNYKWTDTKTTYGCQTVSHDYILPLHQERERERERRGTSFRVIDSYLVCKRDTSTSLSSQYLVSPIFMTTEGCLLAIIYGMNSTSWMSFSSVTKNLTKHEHDVNVLWNYYYVCVMCLCLFYSYL